MRVCDVMSRDVLTIGSSESCHEAAARMLRGKVRHLPVVDARGLLAGVVTDRDLRHRLLAPAVLGPTGGALGVSVEAVLRGVPVRDVMSSPAVTAWPEEEITGAVEAMREGRIGSLPVVEEGRVVGIVTETDILRQIVRASESSDDGVETIVVSFP